MTDAASTGTTAPAPGASLPAPGAETEQSIAADLARRGLFAAPAVVVVAGLVAGAAGAASAAFALALVVANFLAAARSLTWAARISPGAYLGTALGGYFVRLGVITAAVIAVRGFAWVDLPTLGVTLVVTHLGLLVWELRHVSLTLAAPGLKSDRPAPVRGGVASR